MSIPSDPIGPAPDAPSHVIDFPNHDPDPHWPTTDEWFDSEVDSGLEPELWGSYADRWRFTSIPSLSPAQETDGALQAAIDAALRAAVEDIRAMRQRGNV